MKHMLISWFFMLISTDITNQSISNQQIRILSKIDIILIRTINFHHYMQKKNSIVFYFSFYKIDQMIEKKTQISTSEFSKQLEKLILKKYHHLLDVFFKQTSDQLIFHWSYNHKIELINENNMSFNSLYK